MSGLNYCLKQLLKILVDMCRKDVIEVKILSIRRKALVCSEIGYIEKGGKPELIIL